MPDQNNSQSNTHAQSSETFGSVRNASEEFGNVPKGSEAFRIIPNVSERFGSLPQAAERKENHTLTVREVARLFEAAGVARTERSIINWCQPNKMGVCRLDCYLDPNERKYFITQQSVELAIAEEKAKAAKAATPSESSGSVPGDSAKVRTSEEGKVNSDGRPELENQIRDLEITNRVKDRYIDQLQKDRDVFIAQLSNAYRKVGELETKILQLVEPEATRPPYSDAERTS